MNRQDMLRTIQEGYAARVRGDVEGVLRVFAANANFQINSAQSQPQLSYFVEDTNALRRAMTELVETFTFSDMQILDSVIEGSKAVVRHSFTVQAKPTGKSTRTEVLDLFEFEDGKIVSMVQFCDTAIVAHLLDAGSR